MTYIPNPPDETEGDVCTMHGRAYFRGSMKHWMEINPYLLRDLFATHPEDYAQDWAAQLTDAIAEIEGMPQPAFDPDVPF